MLLGQNIKFRRINENLKAAALAKKANVSRSYISHIEKGRVTPSLKTLEKIAKALNCSIIELLTESSSQDSNNPESIQ